MPCRAHGYLEGRIDSLLTRGMLRKNEDGRLSVSPIAVEALRVADGIYASEMESLSAAQAHCLYQRSGLTWDKEQSRQAATLLARWFIYRQLLTAEHASMPLASSGITRRFGNPDQDLRDLLRKAGVLPRDVQAILDEFVDFAAGTPVVKKLTRAVTYVALEGTPPLEACKLLGARTWSEVKVCLDASVAIPYLCSSMFGPTTGRFSTGANECVGLLRQVQSQLVMPWVYINECAAHLLRALDYEDVSNEFADSLGHSENGFVAQFYQLRNVGLPVPGSIREFVAKLSPQAVRIRRDTRDAVRRVMTEIQPLLMGYGIGFDPVPRVADQFQRDVQMAYVFKLRELKRRKSAILVDHDVTTLSYMRQAISRNAEKRMCLTWDAAMIAVAGELKDCGWVVSPHEASDIIQQQLSLSVGRLTALAHGLARVQERPTELARGSLIE